MHKPLSKIREARCIPVFILHDSVVVGGLGEQRKRYRRREGIKTGKEEEVEGAAGEDEVEVDEAASVECTTTLAARSEGEASPRRFCVGPLWEGRMQRGTGLFFVWDWFRSLVERSHLSCSLIVA